MWSSSKAKVEVVLPLEKASSGVLSLWSCFTWGRVWLMLMKRVKKIFLKKYIAVKLVQTAWHQRVIKEVCWNSVSNSWVQVCKRFLSTCRSLCVKYFHWKGFKTLKKPFNTEAALRHSSFLEKKALGFKQDSFKFSVSFTEENEVVNFLFSRTSSL